MRVRERERPRESVDCGDWGLPLHRERKGAEQSREGSVSERFQRETVCMYVFVCVCLTHCASVFVRAGGFGPGKPTLHPHLPLDSIVILAAVLLCSAVPSILTTSLSHTVPFTLLLTKSILTYHTIKLFGNIYFTPVIQDKGAIHKG